MTGIRDTKISRWIAETQFKARAEREGLDERHVNALPPQYSCGPARDAPGRGVPCGDATRC